MQIYAKYMKYNTLPLNTIVGWSYLETLIDAIYRYRKNQSIVKTNWT